MRDVTITIINVDEDGTVTLSSEQPKIGIALTATLEDVDGVVADSVKWTWHDVAVQPYYLMRTLIVPTPSLWLRQTPTRRRWQRRAPPWAPCRRRRATQTETWFWQERGTIRASNAVVVNTENVAPKFPSSETGMREVAEGTAADMAINIAAGDTDAAPVTATDANDANEPRADLHAEWH